MNEAKKREGGKLFYEGDFFVIGQVMVFANSRNDVFRGRVVEDVKNRVREKRVALPDIIASDLIKRKSHGCFLG